MCFRPPPLACNAWCDICLQGLVFSGWLERDVRLGSLSEACLQGLGEGKVAASSFRTSYVPLNKQADFINGMQASPVIPCSTSSCRHVWDEPPHAAEWILSIPKSGSICLQDPPCCVAQCSPLP